MQKMYVIPVERYDQMLKSYDEAMEELTAIRAQLESDGAVRRLDVIRMLDHMEEEKVELVHRFCMGLSRGRR